jgi:hypothetical protein
MPAADKLRLTSQHDVVAAVPYLLGFHPDDSLVCVAVHRGAVAFVARVDLPTPTDDPQRRQAAAGVAELVSRHGSAAIIVGYGGADRVEPAAAMLDAALLSANVQVLAVLRVHDGRYYCVTCDAGCPPGGAVYEPATSRIPAEATYRGVAPLPSRAALQQLIEPVTGADRERMRTASDAALRRLAAMLHTEAPTNPAASIADQPSSAPGRALRDGIVAVQHALETTARGETLSDDDAAWLTAVLLIPEVRDHACNACDGGEAHRRLWIDVTRRAISATVAAPACLLAITAYLAGDGALARIAVNRAAQADPGYVLARLLDYALRTGIAPHVWREAMTGTPAT